jgi:hypothetical protein
MVDVSYQMVLSTLQTVGLLVGIFYYIMTLRNQNMTRKGQLLMQTFTRVDTPQRQKALVAMFEIKFKDFNEFLEKYGPNSGTEYWGHIGNMQLFTECLGGMVRENYIDICGVATLLGGGIVYYWSMLEPIKEQLTSYLYPRWCVETEYLYYELLKYGEKHPELKIN